LSYVLSTSAPQSQAEFNAWVFDAYHAAYVSPPPFVNRSDPVSLCSMLFYSVLLTFLAFSFTNAAYVQPHHHS
jgi:hypothetical protein